jgi:hypothetical protein
VGTQRHRTASGDFRSGAETFGDDDTVDVEMIEDVEAGDAPAEERAGREDAEDLAPLFTAENAADYRSRWDVVQRSFVDDPARSVRDGDALLSEVINTLAQTFADERTALERDLSRRNEASTEALRRALRRHRAFFERLLSF